MIMSCGLINGLNNDNHCGVIITHNAVHNVNRIPFQHHMTVSSTFYVLFITIYHYYVLFITITYCINRFQGFVTVGVVVLSITSVLVWYVLCYLWLLVLLFCRLLVF